jgi:hypothetical protein
MALLFDVGHALTSLHPGSNWYIDGEPDDYSNLVWEDDSIPQPTEEEVITERQRLTDEWIKAQYQRQRAEEYPPLTEQLDYIYHNGVEAWKADMIQPVKDKYPKPE